MDIRKLQRAIVDGLEDVKAQHIVVFNTEALSPLFERVIVASGTSNRQTRALAASVREAVKAAGAPVPRLEGQDNGEWIIVDCGAAVAHIMQPSIREYYRLEEIWGVKPVTLKSAVKKARAGLAKAEEPAEPVKAPAARKTPARKPAAKVAPDHRPASGRAPRPGRSATTSSKPAAPRRAASGKTAGKTAASKSTASKGVSSRAAPVRAGAAKRAPGKTAVAAGKPPSTSARTPARKPAPTAARTAARKPAKPAKA